MLIRYLWKKLNILLQNAAICIALSIASIITINGKLEDLLDTPDVFADFTSLGDTMKNINNAIAVNVFFAWIKLFKYISFNKTMTQLSSTLARVSASQLYDFDEKSQIYRRKRKSMYFLELFFFSVCWWRHGLWCNVLHCVFCFRTIRLPTLWNSGKHWTQCISNCFFLTT